MHTLKELRMTNTEENHDGRKQSKIATYIINVISFFIKSIFFIHYILINFPAPLNHLIFFPILSSGLTTFVFFLRNKQKCKE